MKTHLVQRKRRIRARVSGTAERPRASVWRGSTTLVVQLIDDTAQRTLVAVDSKVAGGAGTKVEQAQRVGAAVATQAKQFGISTIVFDRGGYKYHGRIKALAEAMREAGLVF